MNDQATEAKEQTLAAPEGRAASDSSDGADWIGSKCKDWSEYLDRVHLDAETSPLWIFSLDSKHIDAIDVAAAALRGCIAHRRRAGMTTEIKSVSFAKCHEQSRAAICLHWAET